MRLVVAFPSQPHKFSLQKEVLNIYLLFQSLGNWSFFPELLGGVDGVGELEVENRDLMAMYVDEDADIDESGYIEDKDEDCTETDRKVRTLLLAKTVISTSFLMFPQFLTISS